MEQKSAQSHRSARTHTHTHTQPHTRPHTRADLLASGQCEPINNYFMISHMYFGKKNGETAELKKSKRTERKLRRKMGELTQCLQSTNSAKKSHLKWVCCWHPRDTARTMHIGIVVPCKVQTVRKVIWGCCDTRGWHMVCVHVVVTSPWKWAVTPTEKRISVFARIGTHRWTTPCRYLECQV